MKITFQNENMTPWHGNCREVIPTLQGVCGVVTDPPYGVGLAAKRAKQRGGGVTARDGSYCELVISTDIQTENSYGNGSPKVSSWDV